MAIDPQKVRAQFPSLLVTDEGAPRVYLDNPGGTQVARHVIERTSDYYVNLNTNTDGVFHTSVATNEMLDDAHTSIADFINADSGDEIIVGQNMTSLTFSMSRSIGRRMRAGDEIVVTRMDHDGNISPWVLLAEDLGFIIKWLDFDPNTFRYDLNQLDDLLTDRTGLVAVNYASNAIGTINDVKTVASMARRVGALSFVDAVQLAPHAPTDVQHLGCDFLACSAYKFFGPHQGMLWGRRSLLESLVPYKVRAASDKLPVRFETGTLSHEGMAGTIGAIDYLKWLGQEMGAEYVSDFPHLRPATQTLHAAMRAVKTYERMLSAHLIRGLQSIQGITIYGLTEEEDLDDRVPTVALTVDGIPPRTVARLLADENIFCWDGDYYAVEVIRRFGLETSGGMLRVGLAHYNTIEEIDRFVSVLSNCVMAASE